MVGQHTWHVHETYREDGIDYDYNDNNYLLGCITESGYVTAVFENSYHDTALVVMRKWQYDKWSPYISPYVAMGAALGYRDHIAHVGPLSPYGFLGVDIHPVDNRFGVMISTVGATTTLGVRFRFD